MPDNDQGLHTTNEIARISAEVGRYDDRWHTTLIFARTESSANAEHVSTNKIGSNTTPTKELEHFSRFQEARQKILWAFMDEKRR
jgi:hypothetical protein